MNIDLTTIDHRKHKRVSRFTNAMARAIAIDEAKATGCPRFKCPECNVMLPIHYSKFMRDTSKPFVPPTYVCRDCSKNNKYTLVD